MLQTQASVRIEVPFNVQYRAHGALTHLEGILCV